MKVLFLDDNPNRIELARENFKDDDLTVVETAQLAVYALEMSRGWDLVMLDHDLGGELTGMYVVDHIAKTKPDIKRIVVHSWNPVSSYMVDKLCRAGYRAEWKRFQIMQ